MPTGKDIRAKNQRNAATARAGKQVKRPSYAERAANKSPVPPALLYLFIFVVVGGDEVTGIKA
ncbi:hypothetical protein K437DRAFT_95776 [Tilletiaria anomala UBC 951]|uniref:Stress-associated endoplasmic reticulum protein n=1 Tax=Tilletiaria anomala (strain ATCC 24038 / CBS 436.72 / UBC 951) TaxID=1037660 RepID=A0A066WRE1_TILAU|nr:uncharacterized protein K437DRAFT_95776 [Tilletiaria anomala UBC 951]KDN53230.1 hypothetical protein K437DRAFT_95776 [Tilletiaria anomala UBC 951]